MPLHSSTRPPCKQPIAFIAIALVYIFVAISLLFCRFAGRFCYCCSSSLPCRRRRPSRREEGGAVDGVVEGRCRCRAPCCEEQVSALPRRRPFRACRAASPSCVQCTAPLHAAFAFLHYGLVCRWDDARCFASPPGRPRPALYNASSRFFASAKIHDIFYCFFAKFICTVLKKRMERKVATASARYENFSEKIFFISLKNTILTK